MKTAKRMFALCVAVMLVLTSLAVPTFATFTDLTEGTSDFEAVNVLNKLGVINGYEEDGVVKFKPDNNVTRAEFTAMLLRTRGMGKVGSTSLENPPFPDVTTPDVSWAIGNIRTARELGIINGYDDGTFKPNNNVSYEEAIKMIVCALGYGEMGSEGAFWYSKYLMTATSLGFLEGAGGAVSVPATRATIAKMLYNCLEIKLAENNEITTKTILENDLKLTKNVGYISSNPTISLSQPDPNLRDNEVEITTVSGTEKYKVDDVSKYSDMLGAQITFYYTTNAESGIKTLLLATVKQSEIFDLDVNLVYDNTASQIDYYRDEEATRTSSLSISSDSIVVYNGKLYGANAASSTFAQYALDKGAAAIPTIGSVKLLDRNGDNRYDVLFIEDYEAFIVSAVTSSNYTITDNVLRKGLGTNQKVLNYKSDNITFVTSGNKAATFSDIRSGSVICVAESNAANGGDIVKKVVICNDTVSGTISATSTTKGVTINGKNYKFSPQAPWVKNYGTSSPLSEPVMSDSGTFYLDMNGNIIGYNKSAVESNVQYGYLVDVNYENDPLEGEKAELYIVTQKGTKAAYPFYSSSKIDGNPVVFNAVEGYFAGKANPAGAANYPTNSNYTYAQAIKFTTKTHKGQMVLDEVVTADSSSTKLESITTDSLNLYNGILVTDSATYNSSGRQLSVGSTRINIGSAAIIKVPENKTDTSKYKKLSTSDFTNGSTYKVEVFDLTTTNSAKLVLVYGGTSSVGVVKASSPVLVITDIEETTVSDEVRYVLKGYVNSVAREYTLSTTDANTVSIAPTLKEGDVVRLGTDEDGYYTTKSNYRIFSTESGYRTTLGLSYPQDIVGDGSASNPEYRIIWGSAFTRDSEILMVSNDLLNGTEDESTVTDTISIQRTKIDSAQIFTFDLSASASTDFITVHSVSENQQIIDSLGLLSGGSPDEVFIHMSSGNVKTIIIVKR